MPNSLKKKLIRSIKVTHISYSDYLGGAAIASKNINDCIRKKINSSILVFDKKNEKKKNDKKIYFTFANYNRKTTKNILY